MKKLQEVKGLLQKVKTKVLGGEAELVLEASQSYVLSEEEVAEIISHFEEAAGEEVEYELGSGSAFFVDYKLTSVEGSFEPHELNTLLVEIYEAKSRKKNLEYKTLIQVNNIHGEEIVIVSPGVLSLGEIEIKVSLQKNKLAFIEEVTTSYVFDFTYEEYVESFHKLVGQDKDYEEEYKFFLEVEGQIEKYNNLLRQGRFALDKKGKVVVLPPLKTKTEEEGAEK